MRELDLENNLDDQKNYSQVHSKVLHQLIVNSITSSGYSKVVQGHMHEISFEYPVTGLLVVDGLCLIYLIWKHVDPSLNVNVEILREKIESMKLHNYDKNVDDMLTEIEECYERIINMNFSSESILRYTLTALHSGPCRDFNGHIKGVKGNIDLGAGPHAKITFEELVLQHRINI